MFSFNLKNCLNKDPLLIKKVMIRNILSLQSALDTIVHTKHFLYSSANLIFSDANPLRRSAVSKTLLTAYPLISMSCSSVM